MRKEIKILGAIAIVVIIAAIVGANYYQKSEQRLKVSKGRKCFIGFEYLFV